MCVHGICCQKVLATPRRLGVATVGVVCLRHVTSQLSVRGEK